MNLLRMICLSSVAFTALTFSVEGAAAANICAQGFWKGSVVGTPPEAGSSFTCTTKVIHCPPPTAKTTAVTMSNLKATTPAYNEAQFSYACSYQGPTGK